jgi:hypothetical protein
MLPRKGPSEGRETVAWISGGPSSRFAPQCDNSSKHSAKYSAAALGQTHVNISIILTYTIHMHKAYYSLRYTSHESPWHLDDRRAGQRTAPSESVHPSTRPGNIPNKSCPSLRSRTNPSTTSHPAPMKHTAGLRHAAFNLNPTPATTRLLSLLPSPVLAAMTPASESKNR